MTVKVNGLDYHVEIWNDDKSPTIVFLHGFTGSAKTWQRIAGSLSDYKVVLVDLLGHGKTAVPEDASRYVMELQVRDLHDLFSELGFTEFVLAGYSMGGRTALAYAIAHPERLQALILESASPGLKTAAEQVERQQRDSELALTILANGIQSFVDKWENIPLFDSQKKLPFEIRDEIKQERLSQQPQGLANSLIGMGTGSQPSYWNHLKDIHVPVLLITGSMDLKFEAIAGEMKTAFLQVQHQIVEAGHAIHVEKPAEFATIVDEYLRLNIQGGKS
ncbi:2-succinyl-6-hydroxy-2,4-cyclohexadiene-1-carboxylate synthase [Planococcus sp. NCCP-2050]|uniref:2-succinyl-6-hydroxy-2, 4-cyclohexadiene-1-carboxylate synthase n=1 Tax=Planococcus sp. NCCP-2050 TaxID=2944679 RepID=UPI00203EA92C|nr:2-succinyl-6-hydroxy-2,4-cyclohexadiene-1-carboxylate synthase [Planococcus sp. NCCP-2050]GKW46610.1 putative 2-succinyl-6-hydroxy-2,4-cyclohexadiene-1-carboxylate synthase [Planococcus sp. NCCP-2050]